MSRWHAAIRERLAGAALRPEREADVIDEIAQHLDDRYRAGLERGLAEAEAAQLAMAEIEQPEPLARLLRRVHDDPAPAPPVGGPPARVFTGLWQDLRYALRLLRRSPAFTLAAVTTIALSTGPTIAALGLANWLFVRPLPGVVEPDRLATVWFGSSRTAGSHSPWSISYDNVDVLRQSVRSIRGIAGHMDSAVTIVVGENDPEVTSAQHVTANFFDVLGVPMIAGRTFRASEDATPGGEPVVIIDAGIARRYFADPDAAIDKTIRVSSHDFRVIGVTDERFLGVSLTRRPRLWLPGLTTVRTSHVPRARWTFEPTRGPFSAYIVRLAAGATFEQADAELKAATRSLVADARGGKLFETVGPTMFPGVGVEPLARESMAELVRMLLWVGVALIALGAANVANLFAFRSGRRVHESALRRALGASGWRLARVPAIEAVVVALAGGAAGLGLTFIVRAALEGVSIPGFGRLDVPMDWRLFAMSFAVVLTVGVLLSVVPARLAARTPLGVVLGRSSRTTTRAGGALRLGLAVTQIALSLTLVIGALLFLRTIRNLHAVDLGFDPRGVTQLQLALQPQGYVGARGWQFQRDLLTRLQADPTIAAASLVLYPPFSGASFSAPVRLPGDDASTSVTTVANYISPAYFDTIGLPLASGRTFTEHEAFEPGIERGVLVSEALAMKLFGSTTAVGRLLTFPANAMAPVHDVPIVGVARDARWGSFSTRELVMYLPIGAYQRPQSLLVRSSLPVADVLQRARAAVRTLDPAVPVTVTDLPARIAARTAQQRLRAWVFGVPAAIGFVLAAVGTHGLVSQSVTERTREFGIRRAIGATTTQVTRLVLRQAALVIMLGVPIGLVVAIYASRLIASQLFGVTATSPGVYAVAVAGLASVVVAACAAPARRATRVDPAIVLRE